MPICDARKIDFLFVLTVDAKVEGSSAFGLAVSPCKSMTYEGVFLPIEKKQAVH